MLVVDDSGVERYVEDFVVSQSYGRVINSRVPLRAYT